MAISKEFLSLFKGFVENYKHNGSPTFYLWSREQNHENICKYLEELLLIIEQNQELTHDANITEHLHSAVLVSAKTNPFLLNCWVDFFNKYNEQTQLYVPLGSMKASKAPQLRTALASSQEALTLAPITHQTELARLEKQLITLESQNKLLRTQNEQLKTLTLDNNCIEAISEHLLAAQKQLTSIRNRVEEQQNQSSSEEQNTMAPPPPAPPLPPTTPNIPADIVPKSRPECSVAKTAAQPVTTKQNSFFAPHDEINAILKKMKQKRDCLGGQQKDTISIS